MRKARAAGEVDVRRMGLKPQHIANGRAFVNAPCNLNLERHLTPSVRQPTTSELLHQSQNFYMCRLRAEKKNVTRRPSQSVRSEGDEGSFEPEIAGGALSRRAVTIENPSHTTSTNRHTGRYVLKTYYGRTATSCAALISIYPDVFDDAEPTQFPNTTEEAGYTYMRVLVRGDVEQGGATWGPPLHDHCDDDAGISHPDD